MKKFFALLLAVLTLAGLSTAAFAASSYPVYTQDQILGLLSQSAGAGKSFSLDGFLPVYNYWGGLSGSDIITNWFGQCPNDKCSGRAYFYVANGVIYWECPTCHDSGVLSAKKPASGTKTPVCPGCGKSDFDRYTGSIIDGSAILDLLVCRYCGRWIAADPIQPTTPSANVPKTMTCLHSGCSKTAEFKTLFYENGKLLAQYKCSADHTFNIVVDEDSWYYPGSYYPSYSYYSVNVVSAAGGDYEIKGSAYAKYGEDKTVVFYPKTGYALAEVLVNGSSVTPKNNSVTFTVKSDTTVRPYFVKTETLKDYTITLTASGNGTVTAAKNSKYLSSYAKVTAKNSDTVVYNFIAGSGRYKVADVKIDGVSRGSLSSYTFTKLTANHTVEVTFGWQNPYVDIESKYLAAVEYVTEGGIMGAAAKDKNGSLYFSGRNAVTVGDFVAALAELSDTEGKLNDATDRRNWAVNYGVVTNKTDFDAALTVQQACTIVKNYLEALEDLNRVTFAKLNRKASVRDNAISLNLATASTFDTNRAMHRYDIAAVCRLIARLSYK